MQAHLEPIRMQRSKWGALVLAAGFGACSSTPSEPADGGIRIGDKTLEQFQVGATTEHWLISIIGQPTSVTEVEGLGEPTSILRYSVIERSDGGVFAFFSGSDPPKTTATIYFVVRSGIITQFWADREDTATLFGKTEKDKGEKKD